MKGKFILISTVLLAGCASQGISVSDDEILKAKADHVPVIIYDTSFSHGGTPQEVTGLTVRLLNTSDKTIYAVTLLLTFCKGASGQEVEGYSTLPLKGPYAANTAYEYHPGLDGSPAWTMRRTMQMVINGADVVYADGSTESYSDKDVSKLLGKHLSNYCSTTLFPDHVPGQFGG